MYGLMHFDKCIYTHVTITKFNIFNILTDFFPHSGISYFLSLPSPMVTTSFHSLHSLVTTSLFSYL